MTHAPATVRGRFVGLSRSRPPARGAALVISLIMMLLITILGVSMMRSVGLESRMVGSSSDKQHAFQAAQTALQFGEWSLLQPTVGSTSAPCTAQSAQALVCPNAISTPATASSWTSLGTVVNPTVGSTATIFSQGAGFASGVAYAQAPQVYIQYLGVTGTDQSKVYQLDAIGYGGAASSIAVVQSTFIVSSSVKDLGGL